MVVIQSIFCPPTISAPVSNNSSTASLSRTNPACTDEQRGVALLPVPGGGEQGDELRFSHACLCSCIHIYSLGAPKTLGPASSAIYLVDGWGCNCTSRNTTRHYNYYCMPDALEFYGRKSNSNNNHV